MIQVNLPLCYKMFLIRDSQALIKTTKNFVFILEFCNDAKYPPSIALLCSGIFKEAATTTSEKRAMQKESVPSLR